MQTSNLTQYLSVKNIFIAIVAMNILSSIPMSRIGGTFHETAKLTPQAAMPRTSDPTTIAHFVPGETAPLPAERPTMAPQPGSTKSPAQVKSQPRRTSSNPPSVSWMMLLTIGAMALYARYLAVQMAQTAITHAVESVKQIAGALTALKTGENKPTRPARAAGGPPTQVPRKVQHVQPARKSTVVRASRWPFAA